jgi:hypothetical protein
MSKAIKDVIVERWRQIEDEGFTAEHDDQHVDGSLAQVAICYADYAIGQVRQWSPAGCYWPPSWNEAWWKPKDIRRNLVCAGALIIAEIERLDRLEATNKG